MMRSTIFADPHRRGLFATAAVFVAACLAINGVIFASGWNDASDAASPALIPPGPVLGIVWVGLFALMGASRWFYARDTGDFGWRRWISTALAAICLAYPLYTSGLSDQTAGYWGAIATLLAAIGVTTILWPHSRLAAWCVVPTVIWTGWVSLVGTLTGTI